MSGSLRTASQYSGGIGSPSPGEGILLGALPTAAAIFSICFGVGMRQFAGRSVMADLEHIKNDRVESPIAESAK